MSGVTKAKLVDCVVLATGIRRVDAVIAVNAVFQALAISLIDGAHVEVRGFGSFDAVTRAPSVGRNPHNPSVPIPIPGRKAVKFTMGKTLKAALSRVSP